MHSNFPNQRSKMKQKNQDWQSSAYAKTDSRIPKSKAKTVLHQYPWLDFDDSKEKTTTKSDDETIYKQDIENETKEATETIKNSDNSTEKGSSKS